MTSAHVHFGPEDWCEIVKELSMEELGRILFYWHKHPDGVASSSQGDEDDTYDVFMDETSGRNLMGFLVTSNSSNGGMTQDCRIEQRSPIWASIPSVMVSEEEDDMKEYCEKIIDEKIIKPEPIIINNCGYMTQSAKELSDLIGKINTGKDNKATKFSTKNGELDGMFDALMTNGMATLIANDLLEEHVDGFLDGIMNILSESPRKSIKGKLIKYTIIPKKNKGKELKSKIVELMKQLNKLLLSLNIEKQKKFDKESEYDPETEQFRQIGRFYY